MKLFISVVAFCLFFIDQNSADEVMAALDDVTEVAAQNTIGLSPWCKGVPNFYSESKAPDVCCSAKYRCPQFIEPGDTKFGIQNNKKRRLRLCACDKKFANCLDANSLSDPRVAISFVQHPHQQSCIKKTKANRGVIFTLDRIKSILHTKYSFWTSSAVSVGNEEADLYIRQWMNRPANNIEMPDVIT